MCVLVVEIIQLDSTNNPCDKLYEHILDDSQNGMTKIEMADDDGDQVRWVLKHVATLCIW